MRDKLVHLRFSDDVSKADAEYRVDLIARNDAGLQAMNAVLYH